MKTRVLYTSLTLLRHIDPKEYKNAVGQLVPRLGSSLNTNLKWAVDFIEELDRYKCWEWYDEGRAEFYDRHASLAADHIDEIKAEVQHLIQLGRPIPSDVRELGKLGRPKKGEEKPSNRRISHYGTNTAYTLARLDRDRPDLAAQVRAGELSANAAAIKAGWRKKLSALEQIRKLLPKLRPEERVILHRETAS
jgi:hypothetical protein